MRVRKQAKSSAKGTAKKVSPAALRAKNAEFAAFLRQFRQAMGYRTQREMAERLGVAQSAVGAWEIGAYRPSAETMIKIANLAPYPLCNEGWDKAGVDSTKLWHESSNRLMTLALESGLLKAPLLELPNPFDHRERFLPVGVPLSTTATEIACVRIGAPVALFPFRNGQVAIIDRSKTDWWELIDSGSLVAVYFSRYPEVLGWDQRMESRTLARYRSEQPGADNFPPHLIPDSDALIGLQAIHVGWLALEREYDPSFEMLGDRSRWRDDLPVAADRWRVVLRAAEVRGVGGGGLVQLTPWQNKQSWRDHPPISQEHINLLGRVSAFITARLDDTSRRENER